MREGIDPKHRMGSPGYPRKAYRRTNWFVVARLTKHLQRRSQRGWRTRENVGVQAHLEHLGLVRL